MRMHADVDAMPSWAAFERSPFFQHIPRCIFVHKPWTLERAHVVLGHFRDGTSPLLLALRLSRCLHSLPRQSGGLLTSVAHQHRKTVSQVAEVPAPVTGLAVGEVEEGEIPFRRSPKEEKELPTSSMGKCPDRCATVTTSQPSGPSAASSKAGPRAASTAVTSAPKEGQRGDEGANTAYTLHPSRTRLRRNRTVAKPEACASSSSASDARLDALLVQVRELSEKLTKHVSLNAELQRQIVDFSICSCGPSSPSAHVVTVQPFRR